MTNLRTAAEAVLRAYTKMEFLPWAIGEALNPPMAALMAALAQQAEPVDQDRDWSLLEATQGSLREHMAEVQRLREQRDALLEALRWIAQRCPRVLRTHALHQMHLEAAHDAGACARAAIKAAEEKKQ